MSRVDEAMRRATENSASAEEDTLALAREPFPDEVPDRYRPPVEPVTSPPPVAEAPGARHCTHH